MSQLYKKYQLLVWLGLLLVAGWMASSLVTQYLTEQLLWKSSLQRTLPMTVAAVQAEIERNLARSTASITRDDLFLRDWAQNEDASSEAMLAHLRSGQQKDQAITHFFAAENDHRVYDSQGAVRRLDPEMDAWYQKTRNQQLATLVMPEWGVNQRPVIFVTYRVMDQAGNFLGVAGVNLPFDLLSASMDRTMAEQNLRICLVDNSGKIVWSDSKHPVQGNLHTQDDLRPMAQELLAEDHHSNQKIITTAQGNSLLASAFIPELGWTVLVQQSDADAAAGMQSLLLWQIAAGVVLSAGGLLLAWMSIRRHQQHLRQLANSDGMTGLMNRQSFTTSFQQAVQEMRRFKSPFCFILFDIDFLKKINVSHGHVTGDRIIMEIAKMSKQSVRGSDLLCRWGGEQFALLLKKCELEQAYKIAEQLRLNVQNYSFSLEDETPVTISLGVAEWGENETADELFARVDEAMFLAKSEGRNRAEVSYYATSE